MTIKPILTYPGAKWWLADWILHHLPGHRMYLEPFLGSGAVFFHKRPSAYTLLNDRDGDVVNVFRLIRDSGQELAERIELTPWAHQEYIALEPESNKPDGPRSDDPIENARRFLVQSFQAHGVRTDQMSGWWHVGADCHAVTISLWRGLPERLLLVINRLKGAEMKCQDVTAFIAAYHQPRILVSIDPPSIRSTRIGSYCKHEMTLEEHHHLNVLDAYRGPVALSRYAHPLSAEQLAHWQRVTAPSVAECGRARIEARSLNRHARHAQLAMWTETAKEASHGK